MKKLFEARKIIKQNKLTPSGRNDFSKYDYFTPSQIESLVFDACEKTGLLPVFSLIRNELGYEGRLKIIDIKKEGSFIEFIQATDIPVITATNITQQIGGAVTYTERYMLMIAFGIKDNNLDFDTSYKKPNVSVKKTEKLWLNKFTDKTETKITKNWGEAIKYLSADGTIEKIEAKYRISNKNRELLLSESV